MKPITKKTQADIVNHFKMNATVPYLAFLYKRTQTEIEAAIRQRLWDQELEGRGPKYKASQREAVWLKQLVDRKQT